MSPARWSLWGTHLCSHPHGPQAGKGRPGTPHPLLLLLHPAILLVGVQLPRKPQVPERVHEGTVQHLLQHVAAGRQQALQRGPHHRAPLCACTQEAGEPTPLCPPRRAPWGRPTPLRPQTERNEPRTSSGPARGHMAPRGAAGTPALPRAKKWCQVKRTGRSRDTRHGSVPNVHCRTEKAATSGQAPTEVRSGLCPFLLIRPLNLPQGVCMVFTFRKKRAQIKFHKLQKQ